jgi:hypothetical protein
MTEPQESVAILALVSTTQLGIQRLTSNLDTYVLGTLLERLYKRAQLKVDNNNSSGCYRLTTQDALITTNEIKTIQTADEDKQAIDRAIKIIKKTVQLSRNRVATNRAIESREQGTLGIASLFEI